MWITTVDGSEIRRAPVDMVNACKCSNIYMVFVHPGWCRISEPSTVSVVLLHSPLENRSVFLGKLRKAEVFVHRTPQRRIEAKGTKRKFPWVSFPNRTPIQPGFLKYQGALYYQPKQCIVFFFRGNSLKITRDFYCLIPRKMGSHLMTPEFWQRKNWSWSYIQSMATWTTFLELVPKKNFQWSMFDQVNLLAATVKIKMWRGFLLPEPAGANVHVERLRFKHQAWEWPPKSFSDQSWSCSQFFFVLNHPPLTLFESSWGFSTNFPEQWHNRDPELSTTVNQRSHAF